MNRAFDFSNRKKTPKVFRRNLSGFIMNYLMYTYFYYTIRKHIFNNIPSNTECNEISKPLLSSSGRL